MTRGLADVWQYTQAGSREKKINQKLSPSKEKCDISVTEKGFQLVQLTTRLLIAAYLKQMYSILLCQTS